MAERAERILCAVVLLGITGIAFVFTPGTYDMFRLPKTSLLLAEAIVIVTIVLAAMLFGARWPLPRWRDPIVLVPLIAFATMVVLTLLSTRIDPSLRALGTALATLIVFFATVLIARNRGWMLVVVPLLAACVNAIAMIVHESTRAHLQSTAFVGNANEVGSYLGVAALAALVFARASRAHPAGLEARRPAGGTPALLIILAGLIASRTLTAIGALLAATIVLFAMTSWKRAIRAAGIAFAMLAVAVVLVAPLRARAQYMASAAKLGDFNALLSDRVAPFITASMLFAEHPITGTGPGTFAWHYFDGKLRAEERFPSLRKAYSRGINYGEVHNDHLQLLAEGGVVGYAVFAAALVMLARISRGTSDEPRAQFAQRLALPLAVFWAVLALAQFPLETTVVRSLLVHFAALCAAWRTA